jgi:uncharacterized protein YqeY
VTDSALKDDIRRQMTEAMKAGEKVRVSALRMLISSIQYKEVELGHPLSNEEVGDVAAKEVKKRTESIEAFEAAGRNELADTERRERDVIAAFAPPKMSDDEVDALVQEGIAATGATTAKEFGKVMSYVMGKAKGGVDGSVVQQKVRALLAAEDA